MPTSYIALDQEEAHNVRCSGKVLALTALCTGLGFAVLWGGGYGLAEQTPIDTMVLPYTQAARVPVLGRSPTLSSLPGSPAWKELAIAAIEANNRCEVGGLKPTPRITAAMANMRSSDAVTKGKVAPPRFTAVNARGSPRGTTSNTVTYQADDRVGAFPPLGFWDPWGLSTEVTEGQLAYIREAELKHGRICMLASLGIFVGEKWHPLFGQGASPDLPALKTLTQVDLGPFWPAIFATLGGIELLSSTGRTQEYDSGDRTDIARNTPTLKDGLDAGDVGFDPLGLKAKSTPETYYKYQERELAHGRLAMIATLGFLSQELAFPDQPIGYLNAFAPTA